MCTRKTHTWESLVTNIDSFEVKLYDAIRFPKTNILATIGPSSFSQGISKQADSDKVEEMIDAGMNLVRINLAHVEGQHHRDNVARLIARVQGIVQSKKNAVGISVDLAGPKFRVGTLPEEGVEIPEGGTLTLTLPPHSGVIAGSDGNAYKCPLDVEKDFLIQNIRVGQRVLIDDGNFLLIVTQVTKQEVICRAENTWTLKKHKGVNFPGCTLTRSALTEKDNADLAWLFDRTNGIAKDGQIDYVSMSFVKSARDILELRALLAFFRQAHIKIIAKIETVEAVDATNKYAEFDKILSYADGIMVARGDLGAELGILNVPEAQKELIRRANKARKPCIVATQMLETMTKNRTPTRAEVTDVSNAIQEGADTVMLSGETSTGIDPPGVVRMMAKIALRTEQWVTPIGEGDFKGDVYRDFTHAIGRPVVEWAAHIEADLIAVYTTTGHTAKVISHYRPEQRIIAITHNYDTVMELNLYWGIYSVLINYVPKSAEEAKRIVSDVLKRLKLASTGDVIIMTTSMEKIGAESFDTDTIHVFRFE